MSLPDSAASRRLLCLCAMGGLSFMPHCLSASDVPWELRAPPLRRIEIAKTVSLADHGADPSSTANALAVFEAIPGILAATDVPIEISLPKGRYFLETDDDRTLFVWIVGESDFVINGNGSEIVIRSPRVGLFQLTNCRNAIIKGFSVDYDPVPFTQGRLTAVDRSGSFVEVELDEGFPPLDAPMFEQAHDRFAGTRDPDDRRAAKPGQRHAISMLKIVPLGGRRFRMFCHDVNMLDNAAPGDGFWAIARENGRMIVNTDRCTDVSIIDVTVFSAPTAVFAGGWNERINILDCKVLLKPGRIISVNADVVHFHRDRIGPWIEGCEFDGCVDDVMNLYGWRLSIREILGPNRLRVHGLIAPPPLSPDRPGLMSALKGTVVSIVDSETGRTRYRGKVVDVTPDNILTLDTPLGDEPYRCFNPSEPMPTGGDTPWMFSEEKWKADVLVFEGLMSADSVIRNNTIRRGHRFGVILPSRRGLVENNTFEDMSAAAIVVLNRMNYWPPWIQYHARGDMVIRGNTIRNGNRSLTYADQNIDADIHVAFHNRHFADADSYELSNILIENNTIVNWRGAGIHVGSTSGVVIRNNTLTCEDPATPLWPPAEKNMDLRNAAIVVRNSENVRIEGNRVADPRDIEAIYVEPGTVTQVRIEGNERTR